MSKLMFAFLLLCSAAIYNPQGVRDFVKLHASEMSWQIKSAVQNLDQLLPSFLRFGRS